MYLQTSISKARVLSLLSIDSRGPTDPEFQAMQKQVRGGVSQTERPTQGSNVVISPLPLDTVIAKLYVLERLGRTESFGCPIFL